MMPMEDSLQTLILSVLSSVLTLLGKIEWDRRRSANGNGHSTKERIASVMSERDEIKFRAMMELAVQGISEAIRRGNEENVERLKDVADAINESAAAMRLIHQEIKDHRDATADTIMQVDEMRTMLRDVHKKTMERRRDD
jgi:hypothetical protein